MNYAYLFHTSDGLKSVHSKNGVMAAAQKLEKLDDCIVHRLVESIPVQLFCHEGNKRPIGPQRSAARRQRRRRRA